MKGSETCIGAGHLTPECLERAARMLRMLAHPQRLKIMRVLELDKEAPVYQLVRETGFPQAVISHHLRQMKMLGLVESERRGREMWYLIADERVLSILDCICLQFSRPEDHAAMKGKRRDENEE